jgi:hypothetical protein
MLVVGHVFMYRSSYLLVALTVCELFNRMEIQCGLGVLYFQYHKGINIAISMNH